MKNTKIEKINREMLDECVDLYISVFSKEPWNDVYESRDQVINFFKNHLENNYFLGYILKLDDKIKGISLGMKKPWINGMEYYIDEICIEKDLQNKGYGSFFLQKIEENLKEEKLNAIILNTNIKFLAFQFYKKHNFEEIGDLRIMAKLI